MAKRSRLEVIRHILDIINKHKSIKLTPLSRKSSLASDRFKEYYNELLEKGFVREIIDSKNQRYIFLTDKGFKFLEKYRAIVSFIDEFEL